jgi:hypothetical protein
MKKAKYLSLMAAGILSLIGGRTLENHLDQKAIEAYQPVRNYLSQNLAVPHSIAVEANKEQKRIKNLGDATQAGTIILYSVLMGLGGGNLTYQLKEKRRRKEWEKEREEYSKGSF